MEPAFRTGCTGNTGGRRLAEPFPMRAEAGQQIGAETFQTGFSHFRTQSSRPRRHSGQTIGRSEAVSSANRSRALS